MAFHASAVVALIPALVFLAPPSSWGHPELLFGLVAIGVIADLNETLLPTGIRLDATIAVALIAVIVAGPLPAIAVSLAILLIGELRHGAHQLIRPGNLANLAGYSWDVFVAAQVVTLAGAGLTPRAGPALFAAGVAMAFTGYFVGPMVYGPAFCGQTAARMLEEFKETLPAGLVMVALGVITALLTVPLGTFALALFAATTVVPQTALNLAVLPRPVASLELPEATRLYAKAIADVMRVPRAERRILARATELPVQAAARDIQGVSAELATWIVETGKLLRPGADFELAAARLVALRASDRFDGADWPRGAAMLSSVPTLSGVVAVACVWAHLTSRGTSALSHADALALLSEHAGTRFDPDVVRAAQTVVAQEAQFAPLPTFQPRVHGWPGPFAWRRIVAPRLLARLVAEN